MDFPIGCIIFFENNSFTQTLLFCQNNFFDVTDIVFLGFDTIVFFSFGEYFQTFSYAFRVFGPGRFLHLESSPNHHN